MRLQTPVFQQEQEPRNPLNGLIVNLHHVMSSDTFTKRESKSTSSRNEKYGSGHPGSHKTFN